MRFSRGGEARTRLCVGFFSVALGCGIVGVEMNMVLLVTQLCCYTRYRIPFFFWEILRREKIASLMVDNAVQEDPCINLLNAFPEIV